MYTSDNAPSRPRFTRNTGQAGARGNAMPHADMGGAREADGRRAQSEQRTREPRRRTRGTGAARCAAAARAGAADACVSSGPPCTSPRPPTPTPPPPSTRRTPPARRLQSPRTSPTPTPLRMVARGIVLEQRTREQQLHRGGNSINSPRQQN